MTVARVELLDQAEGWQDVRYTYEKLMLKIQAVFRRRVEQPGRKIAFAMKGIAPLLSSFSGYYVIEPAEGGGRVEYFHEMTVPYVIAGLVHYEGTKEAKRYIAGLRDYIGAVCK